MGQNKKINKISVQKEMLKEIFIKMIETNKAIMDFQYTLAKRGKERQAIREIIDKSTSAIDIIKGIDHYEILVSLYNSFINKRETFFVTLVATINRKDTIEKWDKSEEGFKEFLELEEKAIAQSDIEEKELKEKVEIIKKAKEEGKKVELMYIDGKVKPVVVNEKPN
jgi:hypothetical protein